MSVSAVPDPGNSPHDGSGGTGASHGAASEPVAAQRARALAAWDAFRSTAEAVDVDAPSRLPGWSGRAVVAHLASWPEEPLLARLLAEARGDKAAADRPLDPDAANAALVAAHADATLDELLAALDDGRARLAEAFDAVEAEGIGLAPTGSQVGPVPLLTQLGAVAYELAVHAADLAPCGAPDPAPELLDAGLLALADITGAIAARHGVTARVSLLAPDAGWSFASDADGWTVTPATPGKRPGPAVRASSALVLLDASAGRRAVPPLMMKRDLRLDDVVGLLALAPLLDHVPGLPGGPALRVAAGWLGGLGRAMVRLRS
ncbi:maleylpyruvate isomerase N-terminal domain-containing protein [Yinghuangia seranimata]|uniref:maleylpyruvate isomerase N-terminal domain-containing protein n=1 Tax=Yinghuangia seranimata TaxID=408067 RepID=UPI00248D1F44|nr:maleylpyruvate isomerase N-terminal domain-containing protein [Yinghuangia seranimata]MDI2129218.1 maleylpyruvate isomerase N-terminal domain-containing protein [Yinghuangia seranimata]